MVQKTQRVKNRRQLLRGNQDNWGRGLGCVRGVGRVKSADVLSRGQPTRCYARREGSEGGGTLAPEGAFICAILPRMVPGLGTGWCRTGFEPTRGS